MLDGEDGIMGSAPIVDYHPLVSSTVSVAIDFTTAAIEMDIMESGFVPCECVLMWMVSE